MRGLARKLRPLVLTTGLLFNLRNLSTKTCCCIWCNRGAGVCGETRCQAHEVAVIGAPGAPNSQLIPVRSRREVIRTWASLAAIGRFAKGLGVRGFVVEL